MLTKKRLLFLPMLLLIIGIMLLISACTPSVTVKTPGGNGGSSLTPLQVLQNSANTMKQLHTFHFELQSTSGTQIGTASAGQPSNISVAVKGNGDQVLPDQQQMHITVNQSNNLAQVITGDKVYIQNNQGQWYVLNKEAFQGNFFNPFSHVNINQNDLLGLILHTKIADHGTETLNGQSMRHISAELDKDALRQLLTDNPQLAGSLGAQNVDTTLNKTKAFKSTVDVWIDETKFYLHRTQLQLNMTVDTTGITSAGPSNVATNMNSTVDLSKYDDPVTITPPTNAIPTDNPATIIGLNLPRTQ